jgi:hypothetical protein
MGIGPAVAGNPPYSPYAGSVDVPVPLPADGPNLVINGDFENTSVVGCVWNMSNADFTAAMANVTAFGDAEEMDIMNDPAGCGYLGPPYNGDVKISFSSDMLDGPVDAFAMELSSPLVIGETYTLKFYAWQFGRDFAPDTGPVLVGLSNSANAFGTQIYSATPDTNAWTEMTDTFAAPIAATYLTCKAAAVGDTWTHADYFSLSSVSSPVEQSSWSVIKGLYR